MFEKIKEIVSEKEVERLDSIVKEIYDVEYANNFSVAYNLGFDTVANLNGSGYENLVRIVDDLNDDANLEEFARWILKKVFNDNKIKMLKEELLINRNRYSFNPYSPGFSIYFSHLETLKH